jgi:ADP-ribose pyrophosphatase YjhB (NUDIX family)
MKQSSGIIVKCNNRILVCQRSTENSEGGKWAIPMGGIEEGERPEDAAYREFHEEMGVEIEGGLQSLGYINRYNKQGGLKSILYLFMYETNDELIPNLELAMDGHEHTECGYMTKEQIEGLYMSDSIKEAILKKLQ